MTQEGDRSKQEGRKVRPGRGLRPQHFKYLVAFNIGLVAAVWLMRRSWLEWAIALALILTIVEVVAVAVLSEQ